MEDQILSLLLKNPALTAFIVVMSVLIVTMVLAYFNAIPVKGTSWYLIEKPFKAKAKKGKWLTAVHRRIK